jgi:hypothetical protein
MKGTGKAGIWIRGKLETDDLTKFGKVATAAHNDTGTDYKDMVVWLSSGGGELGAIWIGQIIHDFGMQTYVYENTHCDSICALIWLAGSKRWVHQTSQINWHHPHWRNNYNSRNLTPDQLEGLLWANGVAGLYLGRLGFDMNAAQWLLSDKLVPLTPELAKEIHLEYMVVQRWVCAATTVLCLESRGRSAR